MGKQMISNINEMRALASKFLSDKVSGDLDLRQEFTLDFIRILANEDALLANTLPDRDRELQRVKKVCFHNPVVLAAEADYYMNMIKNLSGEYDFDSSFTSKLKQTAESVKAADMSKNELLHGYIEATMILDSADPAVNMLSVEQNGNRLFGVDFSSDDVYNITHDVIVNSDCRAAKNKNKISDVKLNIMAAVSGGDLNMDNFHEELKDPKYDRWARSAFEDMLRGIYSDDDNWEMGRAEVDPIMLCSINGVPMANVVKNSPLYDKSKSIQEQAPRCAIAALLEGNASLEVRRYDYESGKISDAVKAEVKPDVKEPFSFVRWIKRVFGFATGEPSKKERMASIGSSDAEIDNSEHSKAVLLRHAKGDAAHLGERMALDEIENAPPKPRMVFYPDKVKDNDKDLSKANNGIDRN